MIEYDQKTLKKIIEFCEKQISLEISNKNKIPVWDSENRNKHQYKAEGIAIIQGYVLAMLQNNKKQGGE